MVAQVGEMIYNKIADTNKRILNIKTSEYLPCSGIYPRVYK